MLQPANSVNDNASAAAHHKILLTISSSTLMNRVHKPGMILPVLIDDSHHPSGGKEVEWKNPFLDPEGRKGFY
jgi:hypothetical protein